VQDDNVQGNGVQGDNVQGNGVQDDNAQEMQPGVAILQEATRVCRPCFCSTRA
jgi:hypothetical protein